VTTSLRRPLYCCDYFVEKTIVLLCWLGPLSRYGGCLVIGSGFCIASKDLRIAIPLNYNKLQSGLFTVVRRFESDFVYPCFR
jgi:hypothetical protein